MSQVISFGILKGQTGVLHILGNAGESNMMVEMSSELGAKMAASTHH